MKTEIKVGDRVRMRGFNSTGARVEGLVGEVTTLVNNDLRVVSGDCVSYVTPSQCTKLVKKPRREFWINKYSEGGDGAHETKELADRNALPGRLECIHVREVKARKA